MLIHTRESQRWVLLAQFNIKLTVCENITNNSNNSSTHTNFERVMRFQWGKFMLKCLEEKQKNRSTAKNLVVNTRRAGELRPSGNINQHACSGIFNFQPNKTAMTVRMWWQLYRAGERKRKIDNDNSTRYGTYAMLIRAFKIEMETKLRVFDTLNYE